MKHIVETETVNGAVTKRTKRFEISRSEFVSMLRNQGHAVTDGAEIFVNAEGEMCSSVVTETNPIVVSFVEQR